MEQYSYKSAAYRINVARQDANNAWDVVIENRLDGSGVQLKKMGKELNLKEVKFLAVRAVLPLLWNSGSTRGDCSQLLALNSFEKIEISTSRFTQVFYEGSEGNSFKSRTNAHLFFAVKLVKEALGCDYRSHYFKKSENHNDFPGRAFKAMLDVFLDDVDRKNFSFEVADRGSLTYLCHSWEFDPKLTEELNLKISACYSNTDYSFRKLSSFSQYYLNGPLLETLRLRQLFDSLWKPRRANLFDLLEHAIARREGFSFVRIGEGEGAFTSYRRYKADKTRRNEIFGVIGKDIYSIWFKKNILELAEDEYDRLEGAYSDSIRKADYLGVPSEARIVYEYSQLEQDLSRYGYSRGYVGVREALLHAYEVLNESTERPEFIGDCDVARAMYNWQDPQASLEVILPKVLFGLERLHIISCHPHLAGALQSFLSIGQVESILIPPEKGRLSASNMLEGDHFEHYFETISEKCRELNGQVVLVAAGFLGKIYCALIKEAGGVAIDIGSLADYWAGYSTRAKTTSGTVSPFCL